MSGEHRKIYNLTRALGMIGTSLLSHTLTLNDDDDDDAGGSYSASTAGAMPVISPPVVRFAAAVLKRKK